MSAGTIVLGDAGIANLALALALRRAGVEAIDRTQLSQLLVAPVPGPSSKLLVVTANGARVLHALGLKGWLAAHADQPDRMEERSARTGFLRSDLPLGTFGADRFGAPCYLISEAQLGKVLRDELGGSLSDTAPEQAQQTAPDRDALYVYSSDSQGDAVGQLSSDSPRGWQRRGTLALQDVGSAFARDALSAWLGPGFALYLFPAERAQRLELRLLQKAVARLPNPAALPVHGTLRELLSRAHWEQATPIPAPRVQEQLTDGGCVSIGNAAHAPAEPLHQAVAAALESAWVLSRFIDQHDGEPKRAAAQYERYRLKRARLLVERSYEALAALLSPTPRQRLAQTLGSTLTSRFLPELALARLDWIYRYDCVRGFE